MKVHNTEAVKAYQARHPERVRAQRQRHYSRRSEFINEYKLKRGCVDCGYREHPEALDFDHRDGEEKLGNIGQMKRFALDTLLAEMEKCDIRCANCHRVRSKAQRKERDLART